MDADEEMPELIFDDEDIGAKDVETKVIVGGCQTCGYPVSPFDGCNVCAFRVHELRHVICCKRSP